MRGRLFGLGAMAIACVSLAGCGSAAVGSAVPDSQQNGSTTSQGGTAGNSSHLKAPHVKNPLHPTTYVKHPCQLLTDQQMASFDFTSNGDPDEKKTAFGMKCSWFDDTGTIPSSLGVTWISDVSSGLSYVYDQKSTYQSKGYFESVTVNGYPAVYAGKSDDRAEGHCILVVGVRDNLDFMTDVSMGPDRKSEGCSIAKQAAAAAIDTMKGGA